MKVREEAGAVAGACFGGTRARWKRVLFALSL
jgi:hypothetical protein